MIFTSGVQTPTPQPDVAHWFLFQGDRLIVTETGPEAPDAPRVPLAAHPAALGLTSIRTQYLGCLGGDNGPVHCYSGELDAAAPLPAGLTAQDLRQLFDRLDGLLLGVAGRAKQIAHWDRDHQFCGRCATPMTALETERAKQCPACGLTGYSRLSPAVIIAVTRRFPDGERILLARNHRFPTGRYSVIAGFVEAGESLEESVRREIAEEVGIQVQNIRYFGSQPWPFPNSLMLGFTAEYAGGDIVLEANEIADARWFAPGDFPQLPPPASIARQLIDSFAARNGATP